MRTFIQVCDIKEELGSLGEQMEEMRGVCKQLQSELKKFPDYSETPFESEADALMDNWLDVCICSLKHISSIITTFKNNKRQYF